MSLRPSAHCENWMPNCWSGGIGSPPFYGSQLGNNMPSIGNNSGGVRVENPDGTTTIGNTTYNSATGQPITIPVAANGSDLLLRMKTFAVENPVIVLGGAGLAIFLLMRKK